MKKSLSVFLIICLTAALISSCSRGDDSQGMDGADISTEYAGYPQDIPAVGSEKTEIPEIPEKGMNTLVITCTEGTDNCWTFEGSTLRFAGISADTICTISGEFDGNLVIDAGDDFVFELETHGFSLWSSAGCAVTVLSGDKVTLTAKKETQNFIYDTRTAVTDEEEHTAAIYSECDLDIGGKGELTVISSENNGIHSKKDLKVKNLTLSVTCADNALKGNDSLTVSGGTLTLIAGSGDCMKTSNTDVSSKGNQRGTVMLSGCKAELFAACDGIDAAYNTEISEDTVLNIYTDKYSPYSGKAAAANEDSYAVRLNSGNITCSADQPQNPGIFFGGRGDPGLPGGFAYPPDSGGRETPGDPGGFGRQDNFGGRGGPGGQGGMIGGKKDESGHSCKGIKAGNEILISGGNIVIKSYDDSIHANADNALENGEAPTGSVTVSGGVLELYSGDDGIHADGTLTVTDGKINITNSYEGLEGNTVVISGGDISVISADDGINATATAGTGITIGGGTLYVYAGGDGLDANSRSPYQGIVFSGGDAAVISTSSGNSSIDTEQGYSYTGGKVLAICPSGGMGSESTKCQNFSSVASKTNLSLKNGQILSVTVNGNIEKSVSVPCSMSALVIYLGASDSSFSAE